MRKSVCTLCFLIDKDKVLLGEKKVGFGMGKYNGFGGKVRRGETIRDAAIREMREESGLDVSGLKKAGVLCFSLPKRVPAKELEVHVFAARIFKGAVRETREMRPQWFKISDIPYYRMWPDDREWLPLFLKGKKFRGTFLFGEHEDILKQDLSVVAKLAEESR